MLPISQAVEETIHKTPFLEEGLSRNILNLTALAREIRPAIEELTKKEVSTAAIVMALKRRDQALHDMVKNAALRELRNLRNVTVRSNLVEYALKTSPELSPLFSDLLRATTQDRDLFVNFSQGLSESTLITSEAFSETLEAKLNPEQIVEKIAHLASITLRLRPEHLYIPGVNYQVTKALAWNGINIVEIISSYSETTLIVHESDIDRVFRLIKEITASH